MQGSIATRARAPHSAFLSERFAGRLGFNRALGLLLLAGGAIRLGLAIALVHRSYDLNSFRIVDSTLRSHPGALYLTRRWPYPGGLLPWVLASGSLARTTGIDISIFVKLPDIAADLGIAWLVQAFLGLRGASERTRLAAAALVCLGPSFIAVSGYQGQIDALAILPGVAALYVWQRSLAAGRHERPIVWVALLIGLGAAIKTTPILLVLAFLPHLRGLMARARFCALAVAVPVVSVLPWLVVNPHSVSVVVKYTGIGVGPLALAVQPSLAKDILVKGGGVPVGSLAGSLELHGKVILVAVLALTVLVVFLRRPRPERAAALLWLGVYSSMPYFFFQYVLWGLPFLLMAGFIPGVAAAEAILLVPTILWEKVPWTSQIVVWPYYVLMTLAWSMAAISLVVLGHRMYVQRPA